MTLARPDGLLTPALSAFSPNLVARKMFPRRSGWSLSHFPTTSSLSPYASAVSQFVQPNSQARSRSLRRSSSDLVGQVSMNCL